MRLLQLAMILYLYLSFILVYQMYYKKLVYDFNFLSFTLMHQMCFVNCFVNSEYINYKWNMYHI